MPDKHGNLTSHHGRAEVNEKTMDTAYEATKLVLAWVRLNNHDVRLTFHNCPGYESGEYIAKIAGATGLRKRDVALVYMALATAPQEV
jgi:hypothetical protein